jgi:hypothetical protein
MYRQILSAPPSTTTIAAFVVYIAYIAPIAAPLGHSPGTPLHPIAPSAPPFDHQRPGFPTLTNGTAFPSHINGKVTQPRREFTHGDLNETNTARRVHVSYKVHQRTNDRQVDRLHRRVIGHAWE